MAATIQDWLTWWRLKRPAHGALWVHPTGSFRFEEGAEVPARLAAVFGDLTRLTCVDLGCGPAETVIASQVLTVPWRRLISVEGFAPYVEILRTKPVQATRHEILEQRIETVFDVLEPGEADVILLIDVLEHFPRRAGLDLLRRLEGLAGAGIVLFSPVGHVEQEELDGNPMQRHRSFWDPGDWARLGYDVEVYEAFHGHLNPPATAAWAIKRLKPAAAIAARRSSGAVVRP